MPLAASESEMLFAVKVRPTALSSAALAFA
jgi:hypothetical protein